MNKTIQSNRNIDTSLQPLIEEHDHALELCARIRVGLENDIEHERIRAYADWFKLNSLEPHFEVEEKYIFPVLGSNVRVKRALANHRRIRKLLSCSCEDDKVLNLLEEELTSHIRFEERIFLKDSKNLKELSDIRLKHHTNFSDEEWEDKFWLE